MLVIDAALLFQDKTLQNPEKIDKIPELHDEKKKVLEAIDISTKSNCLSQSVPYVNDF